MRLQRHILIGCAFVLLSLVCGGWLLGRHPTHGLTRYDFPSGDLSAPEPKGTLDDQLHFDTEGKEAPEPSPTIGEKQAIRWKGFIELPRAGEYKFRLTSDDGSRLIIDDRKVVDNWGGHSRKAVSGTRVFERGVFPIVVEYDNHTGGGSFELEMRFPSGYHSTGRIPVSFLYIDRPAAKTALDHALRHGMWLWLLLAGLAFAWKPLSQAASRAVQGGEARWALLLGAMVFLVALGARTADMGGQGETCDEWAYVSAGRVYVQNLVAGVVDAEQYKINREHPAFGKLYYGVAIHLFGDGPNVPRGAAAFLSSLTALLAFLIGRRVTNLLGASVGGFVFALLPPALAHGNIGTLEAPLALLYTLAFYFFIRVLLEPEHRSRLFAGLGVTLGFAVATKFSAALMLPFFFGAWIVFNWRRIRSTGDVPMPLTLYLTFAFVAVPTFATWPWLWGDTLPHITETLSHWKKTPGAETFLGETLTLRPRTYFAAYFFAAVPVGVIALSTVGIVAAFRRFTAAHLVMVGWLLLPFGWSFMALKQGGYRYVYPAFVPLSILAGIGVGALADGFGRWFGRGAAVFIVLYTGLLAYKSHPYCHYYFNEAVGGASGAVDDRLFEVGHWGEGLDKAATWLNANAPENATYGLDTNVNHTFNSMRKDLRRLSTKAMKRRRPDFLVQDGVFRENSDLDAYDEVFAVRLGTARIVGVFKRTGPKMKAAKKKR